MLRADCLGFPLVLSVLLPLLCFSFNLGVFLFFVLMLSLDGVFFPFAFNLINLYPLPQAVF